MFLSDETAGALTTTEPTTVNHVSKPVLIILESEAKALFVNYRGVVIDDAFGTSGTSGTSPASALNAGALTVSGTSGTFALDFSQSGGFYGTAGTTGMTVTFANPTGGQVYRFMVKQGTSGTSTITSWPSLNGTAGFWLQSGTAGTTMPAISQFAGARDVITIWYVDGVYLASFTEA
jgi:hypothetical protein